MSKVVDNIVVGTPLVELSALGVTDDEVTIHFVVDDVENDKGNVFLPTILKKAGFFTSSNQIKSINDQRQASGKFDNDPDQNLWRNLDDFEFTEFKIGKRVFWLIVGE